MGTVLFELDERRVLAVSVAEEMDVDWMRGISTVMEVKQSREARELQELLRFPPPGVLLELMLKSRSFRFF